MDKIVTQGPWCFENNLMSIVWWERGIKIQDDSFKMVSFWFQVSGLPLECYTMDVGRKVAGLFSECKEIQIRASQEEGGRNFFRFRALVDLSPHQERN